MPARTCGRLISDLVGTSRRQSSNRTVTAHSVWRRLHAASRQPRHHNHQHSASVTSQYNYRHHFRLIGGNDIILSWRQQQHQQLLPVPRWTMGRTTQCPTAHSQNTCFRSHHGVTLTTKNDRRWRHRIYRRRYDRSPWQRLDEAMSPERLTSSDRIRRGHVIVSATIVLEQWAVVWRQVSRVHLNHENYRDHSSTSPINSDSEVLER